MSNDAIRANAPGLPTTRRTLFQGLAGASAALALPKAVKAAEITPEQRKLVTEAEMAAMPFEPWPDAMKMRDDLTRKRWDEASLQALAAAHFALTILSKTKADLVKIVDEGVDQDWPEDQCFARTTCELLQDSRAWLRETADLLDHAEVRFMCAVAASLQDEDAA